MALPVPVPTPKKSPLLAALETAPVDDERETDEECADVEAARQDVRAGRVVSHEEVRRAWLERQ